LKFAGTPPSCSAPLAAANRQRRPPGGGLSLSVAPGPVPGNRLAGLAPAWPCDGVAPLCARGGHLRAEASNCKTGGERTKKECEPCGLAAEPRLGLLKWWSCLLGEPPPILPSAEQLLDCTPERADLLEYHTCPTPSPKKNKLELLSTTRTLRAPPTRLRDAVPMACAFRLGRYLNGSTGRLAEFPSGPTREGFQHGPTTPCAVAHPSRGGPRRWAVPATGASG